MREKTATDAPAGTVTSRTYNQVEEQQFTIQRQESEINNLNRELLALYRRLHNC